MPQAVPAAPALITSSAFRFLSPEIQISETDESSRSQSAFADHTTDIRMGFVLWLSQDHVSHTPELSAVKSQMYRTVHGVS